MNFLEQFADRVNEIQLFRENALKKELLIINYFGKFGIGKSWLARFIVEDCKNYRIPPLYMDLNYEPQCDYLYLITKIRDCGKPKIFNKLEEKINESLISFKTVYLKTSDNRKTKLRLGKSNQFTGSFSEIAIGGDIIKPNIILPDGLITQLTKLMKNNVTFTFIDCLKIFQKKSGDRFYVIIDAFDKANEEFIAWFWNDLIIRLIDNDINCLQFIICGENPITPKSFLFGTYLTCELKPFSNHDIIEYFNKRKIMNFDIQDVATKTKGHPLTLGMYADELSNIF